MLFVCLSDMHSIFNHDYFTNSTQKYVPPPCLCTHSIPSGPKIYYHTLQKPDPITARYRYQCADITSRLSDTISNIAANAIWRHFI